jgi:hypothetical protein
VYKQALASLVKQYPNSEEAKTATALLTALDEKALQYTSPVAADTQTTPPAQAAADSSAAAKTNYTANPEGAHYFAILFESKQPSNDLLFALESYNAEHFLDQNYEVSIRNLAKGYTVALVKSFDNRQDAAAYAQKLTEENVLVSFDPAAFRRLLITPENLELLAATGQVIDYLEFFNTEYANDIPANH